MNCKEFHDQLLDLASGTAAPEAQAHAVACSACAAQLASLRQTMSLLDEWSAPADVSPYFMTRLRARVREEAEPVGWLAWFRKPALAVAMTVLMVLSIGLFQGGWHSDNRAGKPDVRAQLKPGTPVGDLQYLDRNHDLLADFEMLDGLEKN
jgi:anti-sigma factor RsiW